MEFFESSTRRSALPLSGCIQRLIGRGEPVILLTGAGQENASWTGIPPDCSYLGTPPAYTLDHGNVNLHRH